MATGELEQAADLTRQALEALDRAGGDADVPAALLDHGLTMIELLLAGRRADNETAQLN